MTAIFAGLAALIHVYIFALESVLWGKPTTNKAFGVTPDQAETNRLFAFNQGFYNLFLAIAAFAGIALRRSHPDMGATLVIYACASMVGAGVVLFLSERRLIRPALIQAGPPLLALVALFL